MNKEIRRTLGRAIPIDPPFMDSAEPVGVKTEAHHTKDEEPVQATRGTGARTLEGLAVAIAKDVYEHIHRTPRPWDEYGTVNSPDELVEPILKALEDRSC